MMSKWEIFWDWFISILLWTMLAACVVFAIILFAILGPKEHAIVTKCEQDLGGFWHRGICLNKSAIIEVK
jgi:site-specific recombinase